MSSRRGRPTARWAAALAATGLAVAAAAGGGAEGSGSRDAAPALRPVISLASDPGEGTRELRPVDDLVRASRRAGSLRGTGTLERVAGSGPGSGDGASRRYVVEVEDGLPVNRAAFAAEVERTLADPRGWTRGGAVAVRRVDSGPVSFKVTLASPETTDALCAPHDTHGRLSCARGDRAILNVRRWLEGARSYGDDLAGYRRYLVNHEVGHALGYASHGSCPRRGEPAPAMMQQTRGLGGCSPSPWPTARERAAISR